MEDAIEGMFLILEKIFPRVFVSTRPSAIGDKIDEYAVVRISNGERDRGDTYNTARMFISLFVRDKPGELENTLRLKELKNSLMELFPVIRDRFTADRPVVIGVGGDSGFHYRTIQVSITLNKKTLNP